MSKAEVEIKVTGKDKFIRDIKETETTTQSVFKNIAQYAATYLSVDLLKDFGVAMVKTRAEFEKLEAVLGNTLGSKSAAQTSLAKIQDFASKTPFSVKELTSAFVKLANQGFVPTTNEMRKLGDIASSTGKQFDQLAEAILDAQTGEFERLKEFGIKAAVAGDKVTFTFKGVKTQVDNTADSIQKYVLSLGDAEGVSGSMAVISETLTGKISNLGDAWDSLLNNLGKMSQTGASAGLGLLSDLLSDINKKLEIANQGLRMGSMKIIEQVKNDKELGRTQAERLANYKNQLNKTVLAELDYQQKQMEWEQTLVDLGEQNSNVNDEAIKQSKLKLQQAKDQIILIEDEVKALKKLEQQQARNVQNNKKTSTRDNTPVKNIGGRTFDLKEFVAETVALDTQMQNIEKDFNGLNLQMRDIPWMDWDDKIKPDGLLISTQKIKTTFLDLTESIKAMMADMVISIAESLGTMIAGGGGLESMLADMATVMTNFLSQIGKMMITFGIAQMAFLIAISNPSPVAAAALIVGGAALVGIASAIKTTMAKGPKPMADGGLVYGPTMILSGEYSGASTNPEVVAPLSKLQGMLNGGGGGQYTLRIEGRDLVAVLDRQMSFNKRTT